MSTGKEAYRPLNDFFRAFFGKPPMHKHHLILKLGQTNKKFEIPMTETRKFVKSIAPLCFEFVILVIGYFLLFEICYL